jgi:hypothetical protein
VFPHCKDIFDQHNAVGGKCLDVDEVGMPISAGARAHILSSVTGPEGVD